MLKICFKFKPIVILAIQKKDESKQFQRSNILFAGKQAKLNDYVWVSIALHINSTTVSRKKKRVADLAIGMCFISRWSGAILIKRIHNLLTTTNMI